MLSIEVRREAWTCEEAAAISVMDCGVSLCCYPCVYGASLGRECSKTPTQPRMLFDCTAVCWLGAILAPCTGVFIRMLQRPSNEKVVRAAVAAITHETCCCLCFGAPCAMNDFRLETPLDLRGLLIDRTQEFVAAEAYIPPPTALPIRTQSCHGLSRRTAEACSPSPLFPDPQRRRHVSANERIGGTGDPCTKL